VTARELIRHADADALAQAVARRLVDSVTQAQAKRGLAHLVLTGGGIGTATLAALAASAELGSIDWQRIHLWWGDERFVPSGDPDRNETGARAALIDALAIPEGHVHPMAGPDRAATPEDSAAGYSAQLREMGGGQVPQFDVLLLGIGPDAHVASLFPGHPANQATGVATAVHDSPKPPPTRVSLTFSALNRARATWVLASGQSKAEAIRLAFSPQATPEPVPASGVHGSERTLFLVDEDAAALLPAGFGSAAG